MKFRMGALVAAALLVLPVITVAFPFWLEAPKRDNPRDPANPANTNRYLTPYVPAAVFSATPTPSASPTWTNTPFVTATPTATPSASMTNTPFLTPTPTMTVSPTHTVSPTPTEIIITSLITDFENTATGDRTYWNDGPILTVLDPLGSTLSPNPWMPDSATAGGAYGSSAYAGCISGDLLVRIEPPATPQYPYALIAVELIPGGTAPPPGGADVDVTAYAPNQGLKFDYKSGYAGVQYRVKIATQAVSDFGYYEYVFTAPDTAWHTLEVYFPGVGGAPANFAQPVWAAPVAWDPTAIGGVIFEVVSQSTGPVTYDLCVDNVTFDVAALGAPTATPTVGTGTMVMDFENISGNDLTLPPFSQSVVTGVDAHGSTISPLPWTATSGNIPGSNAAGPASAYSGCFDGSLVQQDAGGGIFPYALMELLLAANGWGGGGGSVDITPYAPNQRLALDYKANVLGATYTVQIVTQNVADYGFYEYWFTPSDTNWNTLVVNFPGTGAGNEFAQPGWATPAAWDPTQAGEIIVKVVASDSGPVNFDLCIDNLKFD